MTETTLGLGDRIPGKHVQINNGIPQFSKLATNHTGYLSEKDGQQYYTIGEKGQPGYGVTYVNADSQIMTNIWTGQPLYGGRQKIEINEDNLQILAHSFESDVHRQLSRAGEYLKHSYEIVGMRQRSFELGCINSKWHLLTSLNTRLEIPFSKELPPPEIGLNLNLICCFLF
ncbi:hypothetical protein [Neobacillus fumarioli]|uniref:hypothetical protein n=1 Tax=Neobacillus fumarioli TaxID=105229 RepID=UPI0012ED2CAD|nr:hypothetical protein [Neobacillus fumarioli]